MRILCNLERVSVYLEVDSVNLQSTSVYLAAQTFYLEQHSVNRANNLDQHSVYLANNPVLQSIIKPNLSKLYILEPLLTDNFAKKQIHCMQPGDLIHLHYNYYKEA